MAAGMGMVVGVGADASPAVVSAADVSLLDHGQVDLSNLSHLLAAETCDGDGDGDGDGEGEDEDEDEGQSHGQGQGLSRKGCETASKMACSGAGTNAAMGGGAENSPNGSGQGPRARDPDLSATPSLHKVRSTRLFNQLDLGFLASGGGSDSNSNHGAAKRTMADLEGYSQDSMGSGSRHSRGSNSTTGTSGTGTGGKPSAKPGGLLGRVLSGV
jgi:hypothetical protein